MYPPPFAYERPASLEDAVELLARHDGEVEMLAGGHSLLPRLKLRESHPDLIVDINVVPDLAGGVDVDGVVAIPSLTRHVEVARSAAIEAAVPLLTDVAARIGDPQVRNAGTIGGAAAEIYPGGDWAPALISTGADLVCQGPSGQRRLPAGEQFASGDAVALSPDEILVRVEVPVAQEGTGGAHLRLERRMGLAVCNCSAQVTLDEQGAYLAVAAAWGGLRPAPVVAVLDEFLIGESPSADLHRRAAVAAVEAVESFTDVRGSAAYRKKVGAVILARALDAAARRAKGEKVEVRDVI